MGKSMYNLGKQMQQEDTKQYSHITIQNNRILNFQHIKGEKRA
jgi:hypothetical protein